MQNHVCRKGLVLGIIVLFIGASIIPNISGSNIETRCGKGSVNVSGRNGEITTDDVERAVTHGSGMLLPQDRETLHVLTQEFFVDSQEDIKKLRQNLLTCTVENKEKVEFLKSVYRQNDQSDLFHMAEKSFYSNKALQEVLEILNIYKEDKKLNNPGIYSMVKNYFYEHSFVVFEMARVLKKGGKIYYVNDNVRYAGEVIPVDLILSEFASNAGLNVKNIFKLGRGKGNSSQQMGAHGREELRKCVYLWEK